MTEHAGELLLSLTKYVVALSEDPEKFSKSDLLEPPENVMDEIGAEEWRRVAPKLYEMDRLWPREICGLHFYAVIFSRWRNLREKAESMPELQPYVDRAHAQLKQAARILRGELKKCSGRRPGNGIGGNLMTGKWL